MTLIKRLRRLSKLFRPEAHEAADRIEELEAENEALRKDAERYRWLRSNNDWDCGIVKLYYDDYEVGQGIELDAAIDAAMNSVKGGAS